MGMFDYIKCSYPLPIEIPAWMGQFQTKDLTCYLEEYEISADGLLVCLSDPSEDWSDYHDDLHFYESNWAISTKEGVMYTQDGTGPDYISIEFVARFTEGKVSRITVAQHEQYPAQPASTYRALGEGAT